MDAVFWCMTQGFSSAKRPLPFSFVPEFCYFFRNDLFFLCSFLVDVHVVLFVVFTGPDETIVV